MPRGDATPVLRARHAEVRRLRALLGDPHARRDEGAFVLEGPRVVAGALDRGARIDALYLGTGAEHAFADLVERARSAGASVAELAEGVLEKVGRTVTPQPVLGVAATMPAALDELGDGLVLVGVDLSDPGNAGTLIRSAEAVGAAGVVLAGTSVDPYNPKTVRASAGAVVGVDVVVHAAGAECLDELARQGRRRVGAIPEGGLAHSSAAWPFACAIVLGNEAHGWGPDVTDRLDELVTIPMVAGESLNVAMAGTVLAFAWREAQRR